MPQRIAAAGYAAFGVIATLFWFIMIPHLQSWDPSPAALCLITVAVAAINITGFVFLFRNRREHPQWLILTGEIGNGFSPACYTLRDSGQSFSGICLSHVTGQRGLHAAALAHQRFSRDRAARLTG